jgi:hypothetical protein
MTGYPMHDAEATARLEQLRSTLASIAGDTTPIVVDMNPKAGAGVFGNHGSPAATASNHVGMSGNFTINGEKFWLQLRMFKTGDRALDLVSSGGFFWVECDLSGGTSYRPVYGSKRLFSDAIASTIGLVACFKDMPPSANFRIGINFGTITGTTGNVGFNVDILA